MLHWRFVVAAVLLLFTLCVLVATVQIKTLHRVKSPSVYLNNNTRNTHAYIYIYKCIYTVHIKLCSAKTLPPFHQIFHPVYRRTLGHMHSVVSTAPAPVWVDVVLFSAAITSPLTLPPHVVLWNWGTGISFEIDIQHIRFSIMFTTRRH